MEQIKKHAFDFQKKKRADTTSRTEGRNTEKLIVLLDYF
jgi:hypothetical protein